MNVTITHSATPDTMPTSSKALIRGLAVSIMDNSIMVNNIVFNVPMIQRFPLLIYIKKCISSHIMYTGVMYAWVKDAKRNWSAGIIHHTLIISGSSIINVKILQVFCLQAKNYLLCFQDMGL